MKINHERKNQLKRRLQEKSVEIRENQRKSEKFFHGLQKFAFSRISQEIF